jgi:hypothetical protein
MSATEGSINSNSRVAVRYNVPLEKFQVRSGRFRGRVVRMHTTRMVSCIVEVGSAECDGMGERHSGWRSRFRVFKDKERLDFLRLV